MPTKHTLKSDRTVAIFRALALSSLFLVPLHLAANYFGSYRLDPTAFYAEHSAWQYPDKMHGTYGSVWLTHKLNSIIWTVSIVIHLAVINFRGKVNGLHEILGMLCILTLTLTATTGLNMVIDQRDRYDNISGLFVKSAAALNYSLVVAFVLVFALRPKFTLFGKRFDIHHSQIGYWFVFSPLGALTQFIAYPAFITLLRGAESRASPAQDYDAWLWSLAVTTPVAAALLYGFQYTYWNITRPWMQAGGLKKTA